MLTLLIFCVGVDEVSVNVSVVVGVVSECGCLALEILALGFLTLLVLIIPPLISELGTEEGTVDGGGGTLDG